MFKVLRYINMYVSYKNPNFYFYIIVEYYYYYYYYCYCFFYSQKELGFAKSYLQFFWKKL